MKLVQLSDACAGVVVQALYAVASAGGRLPVEPVEHDSIAAIQRHLLLRDEPLPGAPCALPADLARQVTDPALRRQVVRILAMLPAIDPRLPLEKVAVVEAAAAQLGVAEFGLVMLRRIAARQYKRIGFGLMKRFIDHYWSITGQPRRRDWLSLAWSLMPWLPGLRGALKLDELLAKYRSLASLPEGTLGAAVHQYYTRNGFPIPGSPKSIPEGWARHEIYHILSNYNTSLQGELLLAGFIAGNTEEMPLEIVLPALVQLHAGIVFVPGPSASGLLRPNEFFRAVARGATMNIDLLAGWTLWAEAHLGLDEVRDRYGLPPLSAAEVAVLTPEDAVLAA